MKYKIQLWTPALVVAIFSFTTLWFDKPIIDRLIYSIIFGVSLQGFSAILYFIIIGVTYWMYGLKPNNESDHLYEEKHIVAACLMILVTWIFLQYSYQEKEKNLKVCLDERVNEIMDGDDPSSVLNACLKEDPATTELSD